MKNLIPGLSPTGPGWIFLEISTSNLGKPGRCIKLRISDSANSVRIALHSAVSCVSWHCHSFGTQTMAPSPPPLPPFPRATVTGHRLIEGCQCFGPMKRLLFWEFLILTVILGFLNIFASSCPFRLFFLCRFTTRMFSYNILLRRVIFDNL